VKSSIRKFLLIYLLLAVAITTTLTVVCNYYLDQKDIQEHHDTLLAISAMSYQSLLGDDLRQRPLLKIQRTLNNIPQKIEKHYPKSFFYNQLPNYYLDRFRFQVWSGSHKLLLHSAGTPSTDLSKSKNGFSDKYIHDQKWRVFTTYNPKSHIHTVLAEKYEARFELGQRIALDDLYIMLLTFPISGLLIWIIIGRGLKSLGTLTKALSNRAPNHLDPVNIKLLPKEIKPVVDELNNLLSRLKEGFERETRFAADAAHELRTPLAAVKAQAQVALNTDDINEKNIALQKVIASVNRNTHIVQQLLTMSKLVPEEFNSNNLDAVNLIKITRDILSQLAPTAIENKIELEFQSNKDIETFQGNPTAIGILIRNLVENAIFFSNPNGQVIVMVYQKEDEVVLEVQDNGPGIPKKLQSRVFERFFRALGNKSSGSGLGLAIVQQVVNSHDAKITLDSQPKGRGLIVRVFFNTKTLQLSNHHQKRNKPKG
jgi:two-component system, OmpR family, sensor histidine kinase QseC